MATDKTRERTNKAPTFVAFVDVASIFVHSPRFSGYDDELDNDRAFVCLFRVCPGERFICSETLNWIDHDRIWYKHTSWIFNPKEG